MAGGSPFIWITLLVSCVVRTSDSRHVRRDLIGRTGNSELDRIISRLPITLPEGIDPRNINVTSITVKTCVGVEEQLALLNKQLQLATLRNNQLDEEVFGLRREVRVLKLQLSTCSATASAITSSYKTQLQNKMKQLLETFDSDPFLILKIIAITREVNTLQKKVKLASNSTESATDITVLQRGLQEKIRELNLKKEQMKRNHPNSALILQIISLQNEIWDLEQAESRGEETSLQPSQRMLAVQEQLDRNINELRGKGDAGSAMLQLVSVHSKIAAIQRMITHHIEKSRTNTAHLQRQWRQKVDLLKKKILQLNHDENNVELTQEILLLQSQVDQFRWLMLNAKNTTDSQLKELRAILDEEKKQLSNLQKQLEETDFAQAQLIIKVISIMKEMRELKDDEQQTTSTSQETTLQTVLQAKEREYARAQAEIKELQRKLGLQIEECSGLEERYEQVKTELEQKIAELNRTGDSKAALILNVINLHDDLKALQDLISTTKDPDKISELQRQLEQKQDELNSKTADIETLIANPKIILTIIELQNDIRDLQKKAANETTGDRIKDLQNRVDGLISEIDDKDDENIKLILKIMMLQSQVEHLQRQLSEPQMLQTAQVTQLTNELTAKKKELQKYVNELTEKNESNAKLILTITDLQNQLRNLEKEKHEEAQTASSTIAKLRKQLKAKEAQHSHDQADIKALQRELNQTEAQCSSFEQKVKELQRKLGLQIEECSGLEERYEQVKTELEQKIAELNRTGDSKAALILNVINLHDDLKALQDLISTTKDPDKISELQRQLEQKQDELNSKTADIETLIANPKIILTIIELQNDIRDLQKKAANETTGDRIKDLQNRVDGLISEIDDKDDENIKLILKIMMLQSQVEHLQRQLSEPQMLQTAQVTQLTNELTAKKKELQKYVNELTEKNESNAKLILTITDLQNQLRNLEKEKHEEAQTASSTISKLRKQLKAKEAQHSHDQADIKALQRELNQTEAQCSSFEQKVKELQRKLGLQIEECSGLEERYEQVKTELEQKIAELNRTGDSKAALILNVINLHDDLKALQDLISTTKDPDKISELQRQLEQKQDELNSKTADIETLIANPKIILTIIELQNDIRDLQKKAANETTGDRIKDLQNRVDGLISEIDDKDDENIKLILKIMMLQSQVEHLQRQLSELQMLQTAQVTQLTNELTAKKKELQKYVNELTEKNESNAKLILTITDLQNQLRNLEKEKHEEAQTASSTIAKLRKQLKAKEAQHSHDQAEIKALQRELNQTEAQCSSFEQKVKDLQNSLDDKIKELQSKSDSITSLALQISTLTLQVEELKKQLQNTESKAKIRELQKIIDEKNNELAKKTEELNARSAQPQRLLQIIAIQTEIEKLSNMAANDTNYFKIRALQDHMTHLINGIQDEQDENTKLMFQILAQQDEIARMKKQEESQTKAHLERIKELENDLENIRNQIKEKTRVLDSSDLRIADLSAQIMELHKKIKPLEDEISYLKETNTENLAELQKRLELVKKQLQDSELRLNDADKKNFDLIMEIAELRAQLKRAQKRPSKTTEKNINELEQQLKTQQRENKKLESTNKDLKQEVAELKKCCKDANTHCEDLQRQLQQSQEETDRLQQQLHEKDAKLKQLQQELEEQTTENNRLHHEYSNLEIQLRQTQDNADHLQQQLNEKDAELTWLQQELKEETREKTQLQEDYRELEKEKNKLEDTIEELQKKPIEDDKTIYTKKVTLDPNTAHPRVALSADNTEMSTAEEEQDVPDNPGRFDVVLAALGSTGFSTGRHYWEVSVAELLCYQVGMASQSAQRKGKFSFRPANGYWTILLNKQGQYKAIDKKTVTLSVETQPLTLGILLDYKKGQISFYDAGARSHMYSFIGHRFADKIYPFIHFCVEEGEGQTPIVLVSPGPTDWIK